MKRQRAYKTELAPNNKQKSFFRLCFAAARFAYNWALEDRKTYYEHTGKSLSMYAQKRYFNAMKRDECSWICSADYRAIEQAFANLDAAYQHFFRRIKQGADAPGFPRFKSRRNPVQSYTTRGSIRVEVDRIRLPKIGWIRLKERGYLPSEQDVKLNSATVSFRAGHWFVSLQIEEDVPAPEPAPGEPIGVDWGLHDLVYCSDGTVFENPKPLIRAERKLRRLSKELSRRKRGSANWKKTKKKLARQHLRVANIRKHVLHQVTYTLTAVKQPRAIVIENLNVSGMMKNRRLAKAIADTAPHELRRQFEYKGEWYGVEVMTASRWYASTQTCSACGARQSLTLKDRAYVCSACGLDIGRDLNAAKNLAALAIEGEP